ncbi:acyl-CoA thioesterase [Streptomyces sp. JJ66]|uniref:acyl-CoA thioesterase n=1 Tax=Streptomyces sp. JJ66 TaxID=2803843 RepID=UPI001C575236|nr:thioesterase family protein [Streptomyces sp. JJ66]MBW1603583.1 acyl-CoA thioesterase [Streptomyces sp. JJ66]
MARYTFHCPLRWSDSDTNQHINNVAFARYLEEARVHLQYDMTRALADRAPKDTAYIVARQEIAFRRPLLYRPEPVTIETWVTKIAGASLVLAYEIKDGEDVYATASSTLVSFNTVQQRPARLSDAERDYLTPLLEA